MNNFFKAEHILQLRELALKEVALRVEKKVENTIPENLGVRHERFMACISSNEKTPRKIISDKMEAIARLLYHIFLPLTRDDFLRCGAGCTACAFPISVV